MVEDSSSGVAVCIVVWTAGEQQLSGFRDTVNMVQIELRVPFYSLHLGKYLNTHSRVHIYIHTIYTNICRLFTNYIRVHSHLHTSDLATGNHKGMRQAENSVARSNLTNLLKSLCSPLK